MIESDQLELQLPDEWEITSIGEILKTASGGTPNRRISSYYSGDVPWVKSGELDWKVIQRTEESISNEALANSSAKLFPKGTLLIALYGATIGKLAFLGMDATTNQAICGIFDNCNIPLKYVYFYLLYKRHYLINVGIGGAQPNISQEIIRKLVIPIPPLPEQHRIVAKIEELFSELDNGVEALKTVQQQLKIYRQAVLKWAFEGKLTEEWRKQQTNLSTTEDLLEQIRKERAECEESSDKKTRKNSNADIANSVPPHNVLPIGWCWVRLGDVSESRLGKMLDKEKALR